MTKLSWSNKYLKLRQKMFVDSNFFQEILDFFSVKFCTERDVKNLRTRLKFCHQLKGNIGPRFTFMEGITSFIDRL